MTGQVARSPEGEEREHRTEAGQRPEVPRLAGAGWAAEEEEGAKGDSDMPPGLQIFSAKNCGSPCIPQGGCLASATWAPLYLPGGLLVTLKRLLRRAGGFSPGSPAGSSWARRVRLPPAPLRVSGPCRSCLRRRAPRGIWGGQGSRGGPHQGKVGALRKTLSTVQGRGEEQLTGRESRGGPPPSGQAAWSRCCSFLEGSLPRGAHRTLAGSASIPDPQQLLGTDLELLGLQVAKILIGQVEVLVRQAGRQPAEVGPLPTQGGERQSCSGRIQHPPEAGRSRSRGARWRAASSLCKCGADKRTLQEPNLNF